MFPGGVRCFVFLRPVAVICLALMAPAFFPRTRSNMIRGFIPKCAGAASDRFARAARSPSAAFRSSPMCFTWRRSMAVSGKPRISEIRGFPFLMSRLRVQSARWRLRLPTRTFFTSAAARACNARIWRWAMDFTNPRDAGKTWTHLGLRDAQQITAIVVDPKNPDRVFVAVQGHPYGPNVERGVFRSLDGGKTFEKVLYKDENTGAADLVMDPGNPQILFAALWAARVAPWEIRSGESFVIQGSGLYKSTDGGSTWRQITKGTSGRRRQNRPHWHRHRAQQSQADLSFAGSGQGAGRLSLRRCRRKLAARQRRSPHRRPWPGRNGHCRCSR